MGVLALWVQLQARLSARQVIASRNSEILVRGIDLIRNGTFLPRPRIFLIPRVVSRGAGLRGRARPRVGVGKSSTARHFSFKHTDFLQNSTPLHFGSGRGLGVWAGTGRAEGGAKVQTRSFWSFQAAKSSKCSRLNFPSAQAVPRAWKSSTALTLEFPGREKLEVRAFELSRRPSPSPSVEKFKRAHFGFLRPRKFKLKLRSFELSQRPSPSPSLEKFKRASFVDVSFVSSRPALHSVSSRFPAADVAFPCVSIRSLVRVLAFRFHAFRFALPVLFRGHPRFYRP